MTNRAQAVVGFLGLVGLTTVLFLWGLGSLSLTDPDHGIYADIGQRMVNSGDWITPRFNGLRYLEKPPFFYWLIALTYLIFGPSDWGAFLWPALAGIGGVAVTSLLGMRAFGSMAGLLAGAALATNIGYFVLAKIVATDLLLTLWLSLVFYAFIRCYLGTDKPTGLLLVFYGSMGLAVLTKGLIGLVLPALVIVVFLFWTRELSFLKQLRLTWGIPLLLAVTLPWHLLVAWRNPGFVSFYLLDNQVFRFLGQRAFIEDDIPLSIPAFLVATFALFFPWSIFLPAALWHHFRWRVEGLTRIEKVEIFPWIWAGVVILFFSLVSLRLERYNLPAFPALALIVGKLWTAVSDDRSRSRGMLLGPLALLSLVLAAFSVGTLFFASGFLERVVEWLLSIDVYNRMLEEQGRALPLPPFDQVAPVLRAMLLACALGAAGTWLLLRLRFFRVAVGSFTLGSVAVLWFVAQGYARIADIRSVKPLTVVIRQQADEGAILVHEGPLENSASLPFYLKRQVHVLNGRRGDLDFGSRFPEARGLFLHEADLPGLWQGGGRVLFVTDLPVEVSALRLLGPSHRYLLGQAGTRRLFSNRKE